MALSQWWTKNNQILEHSALRPLPIADFTAPCKRYIITPSDNPFAIIGIYSFNILIILLGILWLWYWYAPSNHNGEYLLGITLIGLATFSNYFANNQNLALYYWLRCCLTMASHGRYGTVKPYCVVK